jgi:hypothetical protein
VQLDSTLFKPSQPLVLDSPIHASPFSESSSVSRNFSIFHLLILIQPIAAFKRIASATPFPDPTNPNGMNIGVTLTPHFTGFSTPNSDESNLVAKTDANILQVLDRVTLEPLAIYSYQAILRELDGPFSASHAGVEDGEFCNYVLSLGPKPCELQA